MIGLVLGVVSVGPEKRATGAGKEYYRFQVQEPSAHDGTQGRKVWCYVWESKDFPIVDGVGEGQEVHVTGRATSSAYEAHGKWLSSISLSVTKLEVRNGGAKGAPPKKTTPAQVPQAPAAEAASVDLPF